MSEIHDAGGPRKRVMREVVETWLTRRHPANGSQSRVLKLVCGHKLVRKPSQGIPKRALCEDCGKESNDVGSPRLA